jgi:hypothetical protein
MTIAQEALDKAKNDPAFRAKLNADPEKVLQAMADRPLETDTFIYRTIVIGLTFMMLSAGVGAFIMAFYGKTIPDVITALGSTALGALAGLLAPSPKRA